jgi:hypothetical protein
MNERERYLRQLAIDAKLKYGARQVVVFICLNLTTYISLN